MEALMSEMKTSALRNPTPSTCIRTYLDIVNLMLGKPGRVHIEVPSRASAVELARLFAGAGVQA
jgi:hypothetical protein